MRTDLRLCDVARIQMGQSPDAESVSESCSNGIPFLQGSAEFTAVHPVTKFSCSRPRRTCQAGDVLISVRAPVGALNRADTRYCIGRGIASITFFDANPAFGYHVLSRCVGELRRVAEGTTFEAIRAGELHALPFPDVSSADQRHTAKILDTAVAAIRQTEGVIERLGQIRRGLHDDLLARGVGADGDLRDATPRDELPADWVRSTVGREFETQLGKMLDRRARRGHSPRPYLGNRAVQWDRADLRDLPVMDFSPAEQERFRLQEGDLLVCEGGEVGRTALWRGELDECFFQKAIHRLRSRGRCDPGFMLAYMRLATRTGRLAGFTTKTSIPHLTREKLEGVPIPIPPRDEQDRILATLDAIDARIREERRGAARLRALRTGLANDLLARRATDESPAWPSVPSAAAD